MLDLEDPWWIVAVVALIGLWVMEVAVPVAIFKPVFAIGNKYVDESVEEGPELPRPEPLGMFWPVTGAALSGLFLGVVFWRYWLSRGESRWMWMVVDGGGCGGWWKTPSTTNIHHS